MPDSLDNTGQGKYINLDGTQYGFIFALSIGFIWVSNYIKNQTIMTLMCSVSTYYFSSNANGEGSAQVMKAMYWSNYYHAGSVALGSLIMSIVNIIEVILESAEGENENAAA